MFVLIPLGGIGGRFGSHGYLDAKPFVRVHGAPIIDWVLQYLKLPPGWELLLPYSSSLERYQFEDHVGHAFPNLKVRFLCLKHQTSGAAETVMLALDNLLSEQEKQASVLCMDGDTFYSIDVVQQYIDSGKGNRVFCFIDTDQLPIYSYVETTGSGKIERIVEKEKISDWACSGAYAFESAAGVIEHALHLMDHKITQKGEFYLSGIIQSMLTREGHTFEIIPLRASNVHCLGTPLQTDIFVQKDEVSPPRRRICFDLDKTLLSRPRVKGDYTTVSPLRPMVDRLKQLKGMGHTIVIHTTRPLSNDHDHGGDPGKDPKRNTVEQLNRFGIPFDEIHFGKPDVDISVDSTAYNAVHDIDKLLGLKNAKVVSRDFNTVEELSVNLVKKSSDVSLKGEIYWYSHIPEEVRDLFPVMRSYDEEYCRWYIMEKVAGSFPASNLLVNNSLNSSILVRILQQLDRIHRCLGTSDDVDIYANYVSKLSKRYAGYDYSSFPDSENIFDYLHVMLGKYQHLDLGVRTVIHGDPVFTNILTTADLNFKFIDMRGQAGDDLTIIGDRNYDYAKVYQSLLGYDHVLSGKEYSEDYLRPLEETLFKNIDTECHKWIPILTMSLLFTLIPLHDNEKCHRYYNLLHRKWREIKARDAA